MNRGTKKSSTTNYKLRLSKDKNSTKDIPTKITIDSNIKIPDKKEFRSFSNKNLYINDNGKDTKYFTKYITINSVDTNDKDNNKY